MVVPEDWAVVTTAVMEVMADMVEILADMVEILADMVVMNMISANTDIKKVKENCLLGQRGYPFRNTSK